MITLIYKAAIYVMSDPFFWPSMAFTTLVGIFVGAVIHNGDMHRSERLFSLYLVMHF